MYLKLAIRNAKRSVCDYLLYIVTLIILTTIMSVSIHVALTGKQAGFQTASLPLLISVILVILTGYMNTFLLKQRAKEFANYILLGMERNSLAWMFLLEILGIGMVCSIAGELAGSGLCFLISAVFQNLVNSFASDSSLLWRGALQTFLYFAAAQLAAALYIRQEMNRLQPGELMTAKKRCQRPAGRRQLTRWKVLFLCSMACLFLFLAGVVLFPDHTVVQFMLSVLALPLLLAIVSFYKVFYLLLAHSRQKQSGFLYRHDALYLAAKLSSEQKNNAVLCSVFSTCLIFSTTCFVFGVTMLCPGITLYAKQEQQWMGFLHICLSIIFIVIYFSILSLLQIIEFRQEAGDFRILSYIGKSGGQLRKLAVKQILLKMTVPALLYFILSFFILYFCYFIVVCVSTGVKSPPKTRSIRPA